jgi:hypothetical protein
VMLIQTCLSFFANRLVIWHRHQSEAKLRLMC